MLFTLGDMDQKDEYRKEGTNSVDMELLNVQLESDIFSKKELIINKLILLQIWSMTTLFSHKEQSSIKN